MTTSVSVAKKTGLLSTTEIDLLKKYAAGLPKDPIGIIVGAGSGTSSLAFLEARPDFRIFSIDTVFPTGGRYTPGEKQNLIDAGWWDKGRVMQLRGDSAVVCKNWPVKFDYAFIDGDHKYGAVKTDIANLWRMCQYGGYIFFHDYADKETKPKAGVKQAVDEFFMDNPSWEPTEHVRFTIGFKRVA